MYMMFGSLDNFNFPLLSTQKNENTIDEMIRNSTRSRELQL